MCQVYLLVDFPRRTRQTEVSRRRLFKGVGTDAAQMAMAADSVVEDLDVIEDIGARQVAGLIDALPNAFLF